MAYRWTDFDDVPLPVGNLEQQHDIAPIESDLLDGIDGRVFSYRGTATKEARKQTIQVRGVYVGATAYLTDGAGNYIVDESGNRIIAGDAYAMLRSQVGALVAKRGAVGRLWRVRLDDGARQWLTARLLQIAYPRKRKDMGLVAELTCLFETAMIACRADDATTTAASVSAGATAGLAVPVGGDIAVHDAVFSAAATSGTVTSVRVQGAGIDWTWTGSLASGQTLTVDAGAQTVRRGSTNAYSGFARASGHTAAGWLPLAPGDNVLLVTVTGGNADISVTHYDQFG